MTLQTVQSPNRNLWMAALKPPMYSVAVMPILVGSVIAYAETGTLHGGVFATFLLSAVLLLVWENLSNDVFDAETGIDANKHHSLVNLTRNRALIFNIGNGCLALGIVGICSIALSQRDFTVLGLILVCCGLGYLYQGPPFRLGYQGLGEPLCFISFAVGVMAAYYSQTQQWSYAAAAAAAMIGMTTTLVLFCSHFHQVDDDLAAGKRSPIVRLGTLRGAQLMPWLCVSVFAIALIATTLQVFPRWTFLFLGSLPLAVRLCRHVLRHHDQPGLVQNAKFVAISFHFWSGLLLCGSFLLASVSPI
ncbi:MAG: 2-carboxy-1,4-naphthoquinone phytyltransferase [Cyanobacteria bacterium P01_A01_bin.114]